MLLIYVRNGNYDMSRQSCELCGRNEAKFRAKVAGMEATVCAECASHGRIIEEVREEKPKEIIRREEKKKRIVETTEEVVEDIGELVREKREELNLKQEELGQKIAEHASMVKRVEHGYIPSIKIAKKLEKTLGLSLVERVNANEQGYSSAKSGGALTLGDIMIIRQKK